MCVNRGGDDVSSNIDDSVRGGCLEAGYSSIASNGISISCGVSPP